MGNSGSSDFTPNDAFGENLVREKTGDFRDSYNVIEQIGLGSISKIYKIQKKPSTLGGSAREDFVKSKKKPDAPWMFHMNNKSPKNDEKMEREPPEYALKEIDLKLVTPQYVEELQNEISLLKELDHPNIIKAYETFRMQRKRIAIVMELCSGGDLYSRYPYTEREAANIVGKILSAVAYMHKNKVIHRDLKFENVMFENESPDADIRVIDFGLAKKYTMNETVQTQRVGTVYTMAPQVLQGVYTDKCDCWSVGVITFMLISGEKPFWGPTKKRIVDKVMRGKYTFNKAAWGHVSEEAKHFVRALLKMDPTQRFGAEDALRARWLRKEFKLSERTPPSSIMEGIRGQLVRYEEGGEFKKLVLNVIARKSTTEEIFQLRKAFDQFDADNDGTISMKEFKSALSTHSYSQEEIEGMFQSLDINDNGVIMYTEFLAATLEAQGHIEEHRLADAFDQLDSDDTGFISKENLYAVLGKKGDDDYVSKLLAEMDTDGDQQISYTEFLRVFKTQKDDVVQDIYDEDASSSDEELLTIESPIPGGRKQCPRQN